MNVADSSAWLEYWSGGANAAAFADAVNSDTKLLVPTITIYEVFRRILQQRGESAALEAASSMMRSPQIALDSTLAVDAAFTSVEHKLPTADSIVYATARHHNALLWTQDSDFQGLPGVRYIAKRK